ncbi:MAG: potassium channel family protein [Longimicrobiales bacterium]
MADTGNDGFPGVQKQDRAHHVLLGLTLLLIAVQPLGTASGGIYTRLVMGAVLIGCLAAIRSNRRALVLGVALGLPALAILLMVPFGGVGAAGMGLGVATIAFVCVVLLGGIFRRGQGRGGVSASDVSASLVVYLLIGVMWAMAYVVLETSRPGSFYGLEGTGSLELRRDLFYFSFVTLTTLGYGDIGPLTPEGRSLVVLESTVGQLYLVVLVASLVAMFLEGRSNQRDG